MPEWNQVDPQLARVAQGVFASLEAERLRRVAEIGYVAPDDEPEHNEWTCPFFGAEYD